MKVPILKKPIFVFNYLKTSPVNTSPVVVPLFTYYFKCAFKLIKSLYFLAFINGLLVTSLFYTAIEANYEASIYNSIVESINTESAARENKDSFLVKALQLTYSLEHSRQPIFEGKKIDGLKSVLLRNSLDDLLTGRGACGSASAILLRILESNGYEVRFGQMKVNNVDGGHIIIETRKNSDNWIVLDPLFNCCFKKPDGQLASFKDVHNNWNYYKQQVPINYPKEYKYEEVRYTNWNKVPVLGHSIKRILTFSLGKEATEQISLRPLLQKKFQVLFYMIQIIAVPVLLLNVMLVSKKIRRHSKKRKKGNLYERNLHPLLMPNLSNLN
jgi:hypothetical protein